MDGFSASAFVVLRRDESMCARFGPGFKPFEDRKVGDTVSSWEGLVSLLKDDEEKEGEVGFNNDVEWVG